MKVVRNVTLDAEVVLEAQKQQLNVSGTCNRLLSDYLKIQSKLPEDQGKLESERNKLTAKLSSITGELEKRRKKEEYDNRNQIKLHFKGSRRS